MTQRIMLEFELADDVEPISTDKLEGFAVMLGASPGDIIAAHAYEIENPDGTNIMLGVSDIYDVPEVLRMIQDSRCSFSGSVSSATVLPSNVLRVTVWVKGVGSDAYDYSVDTLQEVVHSPCTWVLENGRMPRLYTFSTTQHAVFANKYATIKKVYTRK